MDFVTPVGRLVQGGMTLQKKIDPDTNQPKLNADGTPMMECFMAIAIRKDDPQYLDFYTKVYNVARNDFPHLVVNGAITHPRFSFKIQDGDGVDNNGKSVATKEGFAGHWIIKMATQFAPKCFHAGKYDPMQQIADPDSVIKKGYYVRVGGTIRGNGVKPTEASKVPGLFISPNLVELVGFGPEIVSGPNAADAFGKAGAAALPPGASQVPVGAAPALPGSVGAPPALPGVPALPGAALPGVPALPGTAAAPPALPGVPALPGLPPAPAAPPAPSFTMTALAQGVTREAFHGQGWTDDLLLQHGYMVRG